jgi:hypothetical protein
MFDGDTVGECQNQFKEQHIMLRNIILFIAWNIYTKPQKTVNWRNFNGLQGSNLTPL